jgi:hypothetical protein
MEPISNIGPIRWPPGFEPLKTGLKFPRPMPGELSMKKQVILIGKMDELNIIIPQLTGGIAPVLMPVPERSHKLLDLAPCLTDPDLVNSGLFHWTDFENIEFRLYALADQTDSSDKKVWEAIDKVYECAYNAGVAVLADPNLVTGGGVGNGSGGVGGAPEGRRGYRAPEEVYCTHWAFKPQFVHVFNQKTPSAADFALRFKVAWCKGINLEKEYGRRLVKKETGKGTRIFILDTLDESLKKLATASTALPSPTSPPGSALLKLTFLDKEIPLNISPLEALVPFENGTAVPTAPVHDYGKHGIYVSTLANRVAPDAELHLVEVLDQQGHGEVLTLSGVLFLIADFCLKNKPSLGLPLSNVVINLSLEATYDEIAMRSSGIRNRIEKLYSQILKTKYGEAPIYSGTDLMMNLLQDMVNRFYYLPALRMPIQFLNQLGAVIVAASGNLSSDCYDHRPMSMPARFREVIGVGSSNLLGNLSSFSNYAKVLAPGGGDENEENREQDITKLAPEADLSPYGMVSFGGPNTPNIVAPADRGANSSAMGSGVVTDLHFWWGTSFSAPLVSGLAALVIEKSKEVLPIAQQNPATVASFIRENTCGEVIDVHSTILAIHKSPEMGEVLSGLQRGYTGLRFWLWKVLTRRLSQKFTWWRSILIHSAGN